MTTNVAECSAVRFGTTTIGYRIRRSSRRSTVSIAIDPALGVLVTAPRPATVERLDAIVHHKAAWIIRRLKRQSDLPPAPVRELVTGETFLYLGKQYRLRVEVNGRAPETRLSGDRLRVAVAHRVESHERERTVRAALVHWYKGRATARLHARAPFWAAKLGVDVPEIVLTEPRTRWGSASPSGVVRINWRIVQAPPSLLDYVLAHELAHLRVPNHTRAFWAALGRVMPRYEQQRALLRSIGPQLTW